MNYTYLVVSATDFSGEYLLKVNETNAELTFLCTAPTYFPDEIYGLASIPAPFEVNNIYIPNIFSPNNDGKNDNFLLHGNSISQLELKIYNRWGNLVFETTDVNKCWDGRYGGEDCPEGVYYYNVAITGANGETTTKHGNVTIIR